MQTDSHSIVNLPPVKAELLLDKEFVIDRVDERMFGSFIEHLGRAVYGGIYDPGNPRSDRYGFRQDVIEMVKRLKIPVIRYPGGNFVSGFNWEDSIGPCGKRPKRLDLAWSSTESNQFGLHEFCDWSKQAGSEVMYAINLGTRGVDAARNIVEYANHPKGSHWSDLRRENGAADPFGIKLWCLGNEMDGPWQIGQKTAYEYGRAANECAKVMKWVDPSIEVVACGSSSSDMPSFGAWELEMLEQCYDNVDFVSLHRYYGNQQNDLPNFLAKSLDMDAFIKTVASLCDAAGAKRKNKKKLKLSFDEWNVWYHSLGQDKEIIAQNRWGEKLPLLEDVYTFEDALLVGGMLITLLRNADRVKVACLAQLVNSIAPIMTSESGCWAQTIYWPMLLTSQFGRGISLQPVIKAPRFSTCEHDDVLLIDAAAVLGDDESLNVFIINRSTASAVQLACDLRAFGAIKLDEAISLQSDNLKAENTEQKPESVHPTHQTYGSRVENGKMSITLPPASWHLLRLSKETA
ncbi:MAG TPA: alpha-N-arabinofuranosidase [Anaerolineaceae bacterium]|nr:alpha-N-arabinofuranosidase [Anaerolineaceae bacterium]